MEILAGMLGRIRLQLMRLGTLEHKLLDQQAHWVQDPRSWYYSWVVCGIYRSGSHETAVLDGNRDFLFGIYRKCSFKRKPILSI